MGFIFIVPSNVRNIVAEKETGIKVCLLEIQKFYTFEASQDFETNMHSITPLFFLS